MFEKYYFNLSYTELTYFSFVFSDFNDIEISIYQEDFIVDSILCFFSYDKPSKFKYLPSSDEYEQNISLTGSGQENKNKVIFQNSQLEKEFLKDKIERMRIIFGCKAETLDRRDFQNMKNSDDKASEPSQQFINIYSSKNSSNETTSISNISQQKQDSYNYANNTKQLNIDSFKQEDIIQLTLNNQRLTHDTYLEKDTLRQINLLNQKNSVQYTYGYLFIMVQINEQIDEEYNTNSFVIAAIVSAAVLILLIIFVVSCAKRRRQMQNQKREEQLKRAREELSRNNPQSNINQALSQNLLSHNPMSRITQNILINMPQNASLEKQEKQYFQDLEKCFPLLYLNQVYEYFEEEVPTMKKEDISKECSICCCDFEEEDVDKQNNENQQIQRNNTQTQTFQLQNKNNITIELNIITDADKDKQNNKKKPSLRLFTFCNHFFHQNCIHDWLKKNKNCPICRQNLTQFELNQIKNHIEDKIILRTKNLIEKMKNKSKQTETENKEQDQQLQNDQSQQQQKEQLQQLQQQQEQPDLQQQIQQNNQIDVNNPQNQIAVNPPCNEMSENQLKEQILNNQQIFQNQQKGHQQQNIQAQIESNNSNKLEEIKDIKFDQDNKLNQLDNLNQDNFLDSVLTYSPIKQNLGSIEDVSPSKQFNNNNNIQITSISKDSSILNQDQDISAKLQEKKALKSPLRNRKDDYNNKKILKQSSFILDKSPPDKNIRYNNKSLILGQPGLISKGSLNLSHNNINDSSIVSERLQVSDMEQSVILEEDDFKLQLQTNEVEETNVEQYQDAVRNIQFLELIKEDEEEEEKNQAHLKQSTYTSLTQQNTYTIINQITTQKNNSPIQQNNNSSQNSSILCSSEQNQQSQTSETFQNLQSQFIQQQN